MVITQPIRTTAPVISDFPPLDLPCPEVMVLSNGISVHTLDGGDQPVSRCTISFTGGTCDIVSPARLVLLTSMMREGTSGMSGQNISEILDYNGAWLKISADNHSTDITLHSVNSKFDTLLPVITDILKNSTVPADEFYAIRERLRAAAAVSEARVADIANRQYMRLLFGENNPQTLSMPTSAEIGMTERNSVIELYDTIIREGHPRILLSGMIDRQPELIKRYFGHNPVYQPIKKNIVPATPHKCGRYDYDVPSSQQSAVIIAIPAIPRSHPDYIDLRLAVMALGGYFGARLMSEIRENQGLTYGIQASLLGYNEGAVIKIMAQTDPKYVDRMIDSVYEQIILMQREGVNDDELRQLKAHAMSSLAATLDSPFNIMDYHVTLSNIGEDISYFSRQQSAIAGLTSERIATLITEYLEPDKAIVITAGRQ